MITASLAHPDQLFIRGSLRCGFTDGAAGDAQAARAGGELYRARQSRRRGSGDWWRTAVRSQTQSTIAREEIFGPVLSVICARTESEAIAIANDTEYGLNASVFTNDVDRAYGVARQLRSGTVGHNGLRTDFGIAFGGFKQSGIGREGGVEGLLPFLEAKTLLMDALPTEGMEFARPVK